MAEHEGIFLSYRRSDSRDFVERMHEHLARKYGKRNVFLDVEGSIEPGSSFASHIQDVIRQCGVMLAVIGPTCPVPAFPVGERIDDPLKLYAVDVLTVPANLASVPGISFPSGFTREKLPVGAQTLARPFEDAVALRFAHAFQEATTHHRAEPVVCGWKEDGGG